MSKYNTYTEEELAKYAIEAKSLPKSRYWTTLDGYKIPFNRLQDTHLKNILKHMEQRIKVAATPIMKEMQINTYKRLEKEFMNRMLKTTAGKLLYGR